jgi:hypothetical protein
MTSRHQRGYFHARTIAHVAYFLAQAAREELHRWRVVRIP